MSAPVRSPEFLSTPLISENLYSSHPGLSSGLVGTHFGGTIHFSAAALGSTRVVVHISRLRTDCDQIRHRPDLTLVFQCSLDCSGELLDGSTPFCLVIEQPANGHVGAISVDTPRGLLRCLLDVGP